MTRLRVYAHHGPIPTGFSAATPTTTSTTTPPPPPPIKVYWCELIDQNTVDTPGVGVPSYGQTAAIAPDQWRYDLGYDPNAIDFNVTGICVLIVDIQKNDFDYTLITPAGQRIPVPSIIVPGPLSPLASWGNPLAPFGGWQYCWLQVPNVLNAKGVWKIEVRQKPGFLGVPTDAAWVNGVSDVRLYNSPVEGILAVEFTGDEVYPTTTTTTTTSTTTSTTTTTGRPSTTTTGQPTTTTTPKPSTTTTTTSTTTSTTTTTTRPPTFPIGCICILLLILALALIAASAIALVVWGCSGFVNLGLLTAAITSAIVAIILLVIWILLCRDCASLFVLIDWFTRLTIALPVVAALLAFIGLFGCAGGVLAAAGLFGIILAVLNWGQGFLGCTR